MAYAKIAFILYFVMLCFLVNYLVIFFSTNSSKSSESMESSKSTRYTETAQITKTNTTLLLMILSYAKDSERRQTVRDTYLSFPDKYEIHCCFYLLLTHGCFRRFKWMFLVSKWTVNKKVKEEMLQYNDIVLLNCADDYNRLTEKVLEQIRFDVPHFLKSYNKDLWQL
jgi:hypothetical protein